MRNIIKGLRNLRGFTQEEAAKAIGINPRTYCLKEKNPDTFFVSELRKLAIFLEVEEDIFFKDKLTITVINEQL